MNTIILKIEKKYDEKHLFELACNHLFAAKALFQKNLLFFWSANFLLHLSLELVLKSCFLGVKGGHLKSHNLAKLFEEIFNNKEDDLPFKLLDSIQQFHDYRYQIGLAGQHHFDDIRNFIDDIFSELPQELLELYQAAYQAVECSQSVCLPPDKEYAWFPKENVPTS